jgi:hypothetical protein
MLSSKPLSGQADQAILTPVIDWKGHDMRHGTLALGVALAVLAAPVMAQDLQTEYDAALAAFPSAALGLATEEQADAVIAMIPTLVGSWTPLSVLAGPDGFPPPDVISSACEKIVDRIAPTGRVSFTMARTSGDGTKATVTYRYIGGQSFAPSVVETDMMAFYFGDTTGSTPPGQMMAVMARGSLTMPVVISHPSPNILVLVPMGEAATIFGRCP